jgi:hypothetical protein
LQRYDGGIVIDKQKRKKKTEVMITIELIAVEIPGSVI